jgi:ElaB/YqjD/DUF883 family membrane-anchored ribosome-binding protein
LTKKAAGAAETGLEHARTFGDTAQATAQSLADQAQRVVGLAGDTAQQLGKQAEEIVGQARDIAGEAYRRSGQAAEYVGGRVEQQPLASILLAFGVGYAISYLVHSRWSN